MKINGALDIPDEVIAGFCRKWKITGFAPARAFAALSPSPRGRGVGVRARCT